MVQYGQLYSTITVYDELTNGNDELAQWARDRRDTGLFVTPNQRVQSKFQTIADYVVANYPRQHAEPFLDGADPWVIAQSLADGAQLVTREAAVSIGARKVKIPNICRAFDVPCIDTFAMLRNTGASFR
jgi:hypothetical protein